MIDIADKKLDVSNMPCFFLLNERFLRASAFLKLETCQGNLSQKLVWNTTRAGGILQAIFFKKYTDRGWTENAWDPSQNYP